VKVTYNWLKDFVDIKIPAQDLADQLTMAGLEVVSLEERGGDFIFEIEITSNRPDWLSVVGIAQEVCALTGAKIKKQKIKSSVKSKKSSALKIAIEDKKDCPLYTGRVIRNVKVGPSPAWLRERLELVGCRSVNNIVDITNYVLFELGQPMHAFDLDRLGKEEIVVRRAHPSEKIVTIDGLEKELSEKVLVIANAGKPVAVAGVMGGKDTEVNQSTQNILLEAAVFNPVVIRRSRQILGLQSESSYRFERGIDLLATAKASSKAAELIAQLAEGEETVYKAVGQQVLKNKQITLDLEKVDKILGLRIPPLKIKSILADLGFKVSLQSKSKFSVTAPSFRQDVKIAEDLIEEISRVFGFARIPATLPAVMPCVSLRERRDLVSAIKNVLVGLGLNEAITYSLLDRSSLISLSRDIKSEPIQVMNPLSQEQEALRTTLNLGLTRSVAFNLNQKQEYVALFEIANVFLAGTHPKEELMLGLALSGDEPILLSSGAIKDEVGILNLKGILETVFKFLGIKDYEFNLAQDATRVEVFIKQERVGDLLKLSNANREKFNIKNRDIFLAEVSFDKILSYANLDKKLAPLPKYPGITRDISFILKEDISVKDILALFKQSGQPLLASVKIADYYKGKQIPPGYRGLTLSCYYRSPERTLTEEEVQPLHGANCDLLTKQFNVKMR